MNELIEKLNRLSELLLPFAFGKREVVRLLEIPMVISGHILIDDMPGVGKTTLSKAFARLIGRKFARIQGTSDTLPLDILGGEVFDMETKAFRIKKGPIFHEIVLIDEINRMHPKSQSAFLEAMEERHITLGGVHYELPKVHLVLATQNPIENSGTYPLPEAQYDRFSCVLTIGFPEDRLQKDILKNQKYLGLGEQIEQLPELLCESDILALREGVKKVVVADEILDRILALAAWTRDPAQFEYGLSPRGLSILAAALRANAFLEGRDYVIPEDGIELIQPFVAHRIRLRDKSVTHLQLQQLLTEKYRDLCRGL